MSGQIQRLAPVARAEFAWLEQMGFGETTTPGSDLPGPISLRYVGPNAQVGIAIDLSRTEMDVMVAPPEQDYWETGVELSSLLEAHGLPVEIEPRVRDPSDERWAAVIAAHSQALRLLQDFELAGNWSLVDRARAITATRRKANLDALIAAFEAKGQPQRADVIRSIRDHKRR